MIIASLAYLTLLVTPYIKTNIRKLSMWGLVIIMIKYACELLTFTGILRSLFELGAILSDVIGESVFYLASARMIQVISERHGHEHTGRLFAIFAGLYGLSILLGYAIAYGCFKTIAVYLFLIILTFMTAISGVICFLAFPEERRPVGELNEEREGGQGEQQGNG